MLMSMAAKEKTSFRWSAWLAPILFLLAAVVAAGPASALTCGALQTRAWEKTSAPLDSRLDESLQLLNLHQRNESAGYDDALGSPLAAETPAGLLSPPTMSNPWLPGTISGPAPEGGLTINMAFGPNQVAADGSILPGGFGTTEPIPSVDFVRQNLAVIPPFKPQVCGVQQFLIPEGVQIQSGFAAPQVFDGVTYPGGASQVQILNYSDRASLIPLGPPSPIH